jgi:hypothetical protein
MLSASVIRVEISRGKLYVVYRRYRSWDSSVDIVTNIIFQHLAALMYHSFTHFRLECNTNRSQSLLYFKMSVKSYLNATRFGLTNPPSGNCSPIETAALHQLECQCISHYCISFFGLKCVCLRMNILPSLRVIPILRRPSCSPFVCSSP